jgi:hypothetical protein
MIRASAYLLVAGAVWLAEGYVFTQLLGFSMVQIVATGCCYVALYGLAVYALIRSVGETGGFADVARWRYLSLAPMMMVVVGSFASLPVLLLIAALGKVL